MTVVRIDMCLALKLISLWEPFRRSNVEVRESPLGSEKERRVPAISLMFVRSSAKACFSAAELRSSINVVTSLHLHSES
jgi:hypothetical protein